MVEYIPTIVASLLSIINFGCYFFMMKKNKKTKIELETKNIMLEIPNYIIEAKTMFGSNTIAITNYVLARIATKCEEQQIEYKQKVYEKEIKKDIKENNSL